MHDVIVSAEELKRRTILHQDWIPCKAAFIDCRTPGSDKKDNYSFVGSGVSQNAQQHVNLEEPHGFNVGAAGMPHGTINSLHLHFTAEVFINFDGEYLLRWGADGTQGEHLSTDGDVVSVPPWIFRGFTNVGADEGILLTVLGQDDNGGIIWSPAVLKDAESHGLHLTADNRLIDTVAGDEVSEGDVLIKPMPVGEIENLEIFDRDAFRTRVTAPEDRRWTDRPFLCSELPGGGAELSLVIGYGLSEDRRAVPNLNEPHSFNIAWLRATPGEGVLTHRHAESQVVTAKAGRWLIRVNSGADEQTIELGPRDSLSIPPGAWRSFTLIDVGPGQAAKSGTGELLVVSSGDGRVRLEWSPEVAREARECGWVLDPNGYRAPAAVLSSATEDD